MHKLGVAGQVKSFQMNQQNINLVCFQYYIGFQLLQLKYLLNSKLLTLRWSVYILLHHSTSSHSKHYTSGDNKARVCLICCFPIAQLWLDWQHCCLVINNGAHHDGVTFKWIMDSRTLEDAVYFNLAKKSQTLRILILNVHCGVY